ncbi:PqiC family protein [Caballeronia sp. LZ001]|uniref:PqiC family protein n=1 Tax=Caballeronia sp. LZ001 TaxID=3038553 RepID=UPI0028551905|nr:PqiC family protein [Caballeronia sp. LZ001]MDR5806530.1 PqiC family protein [Caballeronia sp. LZ001]
MIVSALVAGCATSPTARLYTLSPVKVAEMPPGTKPVVVAIGPVTVPGLVDRPQIVSAIDANRVTIDEFARWADPLKSQIARVLAADLTQLMPGSIVSVYPQRLNDKAYRASVDVQSFDSSASGSVRLAAIWSIRPPKRNAVEGRTVVSDTTSGPGYGALVNAYSRAVASVANEIALAIQSDMAQ